MGFMIRICLNVKFQQTRNIYISPKGPATPRIWDVKLCISVMTNMWAFVSFSVLGIKLWVEENGGLSTDDPSYSFKFIQLEAQNWYKMLSSFSFNFMYNIAAWLFCIFVISNNKSFISQSLKAEGPLRGKFNFFSPSGFEIQSDFDQRTSKNQILICQIFKVVSE